MFVKQRMTANPFTVTASHTLPQASEVMEAHGVRHLPVVDGERVVGVLSKGDVRAALPSSATTLSASEATYLVSKIKVAKIMSTPPIVISPDALLEEAAVIMRDRKIEILPVVADDRLVGVITESDLLDAFIDILGFRQHGTRLTIDAQDEPGVLSRITGITAAHLANITHLAVYRGQLDRSIVVLGLNSLNTTEIEDEIERAEGMRVVAKLVQAGPSEA